MSANTTVEVDLGARSYPIHIAPGVDGASLQAVMNGRRSFIISDENVAPLYLSQVQEHLGNCIGSSVVPAGETSKRLSVAEDVFGDLLEARADRKTVVVALGGGVVGDLAGFVASTYMRGVPFVQIPTTLLSMVDSSVGGKVAVNHPRGKNMIGRFYQPEGVWMAMDFLKTLSPREMRAGFAEVIKYGLIQDADFFGWLEQHGQRVLAQYPEALLYALERSVRCKADVVSRDEEEGGLRAILNLGHTFGHAEEMLSGYGEVLHGEAVGAGMRAAMALALRLGQASEEDLRRTEAMLKGSELPLVLRQAKRKDEFWAAMQGDKKSEAGEVKFVLTRGIGGCDLPRGIDRNTVEALLKELED